MGAEPRDTAESYSCRTAAPSRGADVGSSEMLACRSLDSRCDRWGRSALNAVTCVIGPSIPLQKHLSFYAWVPSLWLPSKCVTYTLVWHSDRAIFELSLLVLSASYQKGGS